MGGGLVLFLGVGVYIRCVLMCSFHVNIVQRLGGQWPAGPVDGAELAAHVSKPFHVDSHIAAGARTETIRISEPS